MAKKSNRANKINERQIARAEESIALPQFLDHLACVGLGGLFIWSSMHKLLDIKNFFFMVENYELTRGVSSMVVAIFVPALEIVLGLGLIIPFVRRESFLMLIALVMIFTLAIVIAWARGLDIDCGCFNLKILGSGRVGYQKILSNLLLLGVLLLFYVRASRVDKNLHDLKKD